MDEKENLTQDTSEMPEHEMTDEEIAALEKEREQAWEDKIAPCRKAAEQRRNNAAIIAEHDDMLADMLFEMTMNEMEV